MKRLLLGLVLGLGVVSGAQALAPRCAQVDVGNTPTVVAPANPQRTLLTLQNMSHVHIWCVLDGATQTPAPQLTTGSGVGVFLPRFESMEVGPEQYFYVYQPAITFSGDGAPRGSIVCIHRAVTPAGRKLNVCEG